MRQPQPSHATSLSRTASPGHAPKRPRRSASVEPQPSGGAGGSKLAPALYLVATPIGNLGDLSPRALAVLRAADLVACEDTRVTAKLLRLHAVERPLIAYHEHNAARMRPQVLARLLGGEAVALASDAGTPLVSDPGYKLVREAIDAGVEVLAVPGPSAALAALTVSGLPTDRFFVAGFLAPRGAARRRAVAQLAAIPGTLVVFEAARRLPATLAELSASLGPRPAAVARELTKRFEEVRRGSLDQLAEHYAAAGAPRGEVVVVIGPPDAESRVSPDQMDARLGEALTTMRPGPAAAAVAAATGGSRRELYQRALALKGARDRR